MVEVMFAIARFRPHLSEEHQRVLQELRSENANLRLPGCIELSFHGRTRHEPSTALIHVCVFGGGGNEDPKYAYMVVPASSGLVVLHVHDGFG